MKRRILLMISLFVFVGSASPALACGVCDFDEGSEIVGNPNGHQDLLRAMAEAEVPLREYTTDSIRSVEIGSAQALRDFTNWYRYQVAQDNQEELQNRMIAGFVQQGLELGLNFFLPGSGAVASNIRRYGAQAYSTLVNAMPDGTTDPGPYLETVSNRLETNNERRENFVIDMFQRTGDQQLTDQVDMIKMEYVWEREALIAEGGNAGSTRSPGPDTRRLLREIGIGPGGTNTSAQVRERVLTRLMRQVICANHRGNPIRNCQTDGWYFDIAARGAAVRLILVGNPARTFPLTDPAHLARVCPIERRLSALEASGDCQRWRAQQ